METNDVASKRYGSKRRSRGPSFAEESSREREVKRRFGLRNTRAREERMARLKEKDDAKRKVDSREGVHLRAPGKD